MEAKKGSFSGLAHPKKVLVAPLDWGLGHATRCIPIIHALLRRGCIVYLAGEPPVQSLLQAEFPTLPWLPLKGYRVRYGQTASGTTMQLLRQVPRLLRSVRSEHLWLRQQMEQHQFDLVISDNRYGLYHPGAYCIFTGHQLEVQTPLRVATGWLRRLHYRLLRRFHACWVPDLPGVPNLAGLLSHPDPLPTLPLQYISPLSRLRFQAAVRKEHVLLLLSGPEPQRSLLEKILLQQAAVIQQPFVLVRGLPGAQVLPTVPEHIRVYNHLDAAGVQEVMSRASVVVCRSGYSSVMDLAAVQQKSILVPTPGQTEQQYLARHLHRQGLALCRRQQNFDLEEALTAAAGFGYLAWPQAQTNRLEEALDPIFEQLSVAASRTEKEYRI